MTLHDEFVNALEAAIQEHGLCQLAAKSNIPSTYLTRWRYRKSTPTLASIEPLLPFLNWPLRRAHDQRYQRAVQDANARIMELGEELSHTKQQLERANAVNRSLEQILTAALAHAGSEAHADDTTPTDE